MHYNNPKNRFSGFERRWWRRLDSPTFFVYSRILINSLDESDDHFVGEFFRQPVMFWPFQFAFTASGSSLSICFMCLKTSFFVMMPSSRLEKYLKKTEHSELLIIHVKNVLRLLFVEIKGSMLQAADANDRAKFYESNKI